MKKLLIKWLKEAGYSSSYSGHTRTLYIHGITQAHLDHFGFVTCGIKLVAQP